VRWLLRILAGRSRPFILATALVMVALLAFVDWLTGPQVRFFIFYWPAIALAAWFLGAGPGYLMVAVVTGAWLAANAGTLSAEASLAILAWNAAVNLASFALLAWFISWLRQALDRERLRSRTDHLTGVANSRAFTDAVSQAAARARRGGLPLAVGFLDVDDFKVINDRLGHTAGDAVLRSVAQAIRGVLRASDSVGRLGGDEFAILLPDTDAAAAQEVFRRLRHELAELGRRNGWPLSLSIGAIVCRPAECDVDELLRRADALMYRVKSAGKNDVLVADLSAPP